MKRMVAVLIVVLGAIALWLRGASHPRSAIGIEPRASATSPDERSPSSVDPTGVAAHPPSAARSAIDVSNAAPVSEAVTDRVVIRSSVGLDLPFAEVDHGAEGWAKIDLDHGACARASLAGTSSVRAPGHAAKSFAQDAREIVLEPDALLVLHAEGLRTCVRAIEPDDPYTVHDNSERNEVRSELRAGIAWGWLSDSEWAIALDPSRVGEEYSRAVTAIVHWRDERTAWVEFHGESGSRQRWDVPCEQRVPGKPLRVHVERPKGLVAGALDVTLDRFEPTALPSWSLHFPWGSVNGSSDEEFHQRRRIEPGTDDIVYDFAPTGARLAFAARDTSSIAYGRTSFLNDGSDRTLVLRPPIHVTGRLVAPAGLTVQRADLVCDFPDGKENVFGWGIDARNTLPGADGSFDLRGPDEPQRWEQSPLDMPAHVRLVVEAPGFERFEQTYDTHGSASFDCGDVRLAAHQAEVVLAPGHELTVKSVQWFALVTPSPTGMLQWGIRNARLLSDGALEISLLHSDKDPELFDVGSGEARAWPSEPPERILVSVLSDDENLRAFQRDASGRYASVPRADHEIEFRVEALPAPGQSWRSGLIWHDLWGGTVLYASPTQLGQTVHAHLRTPAEGVTLYWSADGAPPRPGQPGFSMPIDSIHAPIVLR